MAKQNIFIVYLHLNLWFRYWYSHVSASVSTGTASIDNNIFLSIASLEIWAALLQGNAFSYVLFLYLSHSHYINAFGFTHISCSILIKCFKRLYPWLSEDKILMI